MTAMIKAVGAAVLVVSLLCAPVRAASPQNTLYLDLEWGRVMIEMLPSVAPKHVARIKQLVRRKFYDGLKFHRVIRGFMAQTGDPQGNGTGGSGRNIAAEFSTVKHARGTVSMARASDPDSADSQFFIMFAPAPFLDGKYTVWGRVISGMEHVDRIRKGLQRSNGMVQDADRIVRIRVAADVDKK